ncbi:hypothetical protein [Actinoalloteichus sp. GBA129-24]|uniref:hypothetical protein n=1 Tax=Actinoalloteichus sp. GBA129-24 TaxID=1612551 RepID=UPI0009505DA0|nr:hypothetical protein [Actinoalloteichus sp. GBA129-24]APU18604.1 hypothetical protein UA75_02825 [Actinoalloteichus sp. GBA129-24]
MQQHSRFLIVDLATEMHTRAARYEPQRMSGFHTDLRQWGDTIAHLALALGAFTKKGQEQWPLDRAVVEHLSKIYVGLGAAAGFAAELPGLFLNAHSEDMRRAQNPRPGEDKWNV